MRAVLISLVVTSMAASSAAAQTHPRIFTPPAPAPRMDIETEMRRNLAPDASDLSPRARHEQRERRERERATLDRAERLAALLNAGQCQEAHRIALAENDTQMAQRIVTVCGGGE